MMVSKIKKKIVVGGIFILLLLIGISWWHQLSRYSMPSFVMEISENKTITNDSLKGYRSCFFIVNHLTAFNLMLIKSLGEHIDFENERLIAIFNHSSTNVSNIKNDDILLINHQPWEEIIEWFNLTNSSTDRLLIYDSDGYFEESSPIVRRKMRKILNQFKKPQISMRGDIKKLTSYIEQTFRSNQDGAYFITENTAKPCLSSGIYAMVEDITNSRKIHFELILTENPSQIEMENLIKERAFRVDVSKANEDLQNAINKWQKQTNRNDMNLLVVKKGDFIKSFPILDPSDVEILEAHKEQLLALFH